jgi:hypothetical protein
MKKLLLPILLGSYFNVNSQVYNAGTNFSMYQDIIPDTLLNYSFPYSNETYGIKLFGNSSNDIELTAHGAASSGGSDAYIRVTSLNPNVYILFGRLDSVQFMSPPYNWDVTKVAKPLNQNDPINTVGAIWNDSILYLTDHSGHSGGNKNVNDWIGGNKYLGIKYQNGSIIKYGWIRLQCTTEDSCYVKDFSYSTTQYTVSVSASPSNGGSVIGGGTYNSGASVTVIATANSGYTFTNWTENSNVVSLSSSYTYTVTGNKTLIANFSQGTGIYNLQVDNNSIIIYPNPSDGKIQITGNQLPIAIGAVTSIEIYNLIGEKIYFRNNNNNLSIYDLDISNSPKGIYIVKIDDGEKIYNKKIIVQ